MTQISLLVLLVFYYSNLYFIDNQKEQFQRCHKLMKRNESFTQELNNQLAIIINQWQLQLIQQNFELQKNSSIHFQNLLSKILHKISQQAKQFQQHNAQVQEQLQQLVKSSLEMRKTIQTLSQQNQEIKNQLYNLHDQTLNKQNLLYSQLEQSKEQIHSMNLYMNKYQQENKRQEDSTNRIQLENKQLKKCLQQYFSEKKEIEKQMQKYRSKYEEMMSRSYTRDQQIRKSILQNADSIKLNKIIQQSQFNENHSPAKEQKEQEQRSISVSVQSYVSKKVLGQEDPQINLCSSLPFSRSEINSITSYQIISQHKKQTDSLSKKKQRNEPASINKIINKALTTKNKWNSLSKRDLAKEGLSQKRDHINNRINMVDAHKNELKSLKNTDIINKNRITNYKHEIDQKYKNKIKDLSKRLQMKEQQIIRLNNQMRLFNISQKNEKISSRLQRSGKKIQGLELKEGGSLQTIRSLTENNNSLYNQLQQYKGKCELYQNQLRKVSSLSQKYINTSEFKELDQKLLRRKLQKFTLTHFCKQSQCFSQNMEQNEEQISKSNDFENLSEKLDNFVKQNNHGSYNYQFEASFKSAVDLQQQQFKEIDELNLITGRQYFSVQNSQIMQRGGPHKTQRCHANQIRIEQNQSQLSSNYMRDGFYVNQYQNCMAIKSFQGIQSIVQRNRLNTELTQKKLIELSLVSQSCLDAISARTRQMTLYKVFSIEIHPSFKHSSNKLQISSNLYEITANIYRQILKIDVSTSTQKVTSIQNAIQKQYNSFYTQTVFQQNIDKQMQYFNKRQSISLQTSPYKLQFCCYQAFHEKIHKFNLQMSQKKNQIIVFPRQNKKKIDSWTVNMVHLKKQKQNISTNTQNSFYIDEMTSTKRVKLQYCQTISLKIHKILVKQRFFSNEEQQNLIEKAQKLEKALQKDFEQNYQCQTKDSFNQINNSFDQNTFSVLNCIQIERETNQNQEKLQSKQQKQQLKPDKISNVSQSVQTTVSNTVVHSPIRQINSLQNSANRQEPYMSPLKAAEIKVSQSKKLKFDILKNHLNWINALRAIRQIQSESRNSFVPLQNQYNQYIYQFTVKKDNIKQQFFLFEGTLIRINQIGKQTCMSIKNMKKDQLKFNKSSLVIGNSQVRILKNMLMINRKNKFKMFKGQMQDGQWTIVKLVVYQAH